MLRGSLQSWRVPELSLQPCTVCRKEMAGRSWPLIWTWLLFCLGPESILEKMDGRQGAQLLLPNDTCTFLCWGSVLFPFMCLPLREPAGGVGTARQAQKELEDGQGHKDHGFPPWLLYGKHKFPKPWLGTSHFSCRQDSALH